MAQDTNTEVEETKIEESKSSTEIATAPNSKELESEVEKEVEKEVKKELESEVKKELESEVEKEVEMKPEQEDKMEYPQGLKLFSIISSLLLALFLSALDRTIIATAIPKITDDFNSVDDIGWYASSFLLTSCAFMLVFGKLYSLYSAKWIFLSALAIFEIGSAICGAAPNSTVLIVGRAVAGLGGAGLFSGAVTIVTYAVPLRKRPIYQGIFGAIFGVSSVVGPLLGGAFTDNVSWRWCFYINLPLGGAAIVLLVFVLHTPPPPNTHDISIRDQFMRLDPIGTAFFLPGVICLILALQWGGIQYSWRSGQVVAPLVVGILLLLGFIGVQIWKGEGATVPPRIIKQRTVASGVFYSFCSGASMIVMVYYIPIWFQTVKGVSAVQSGYRMIALVLSLVLGSFVGGGTTYQSGYYTPAIIASAIIAPIGAGLITTWKVDTDMGKWIGFQVLYGVGLGIGMQQPSMGVQTVLNRKDVGIGAALIFFGQTLGGSIFVAVAQNIFSNELEINLGGIKGINSGSLTSIGATEIRNVVPPAQLNSVLQGFNKSLMTALYVAVAVASCCIIPALTMEWKSVKKADQSGKEKQKGRETSPV